MFPVGVRQSSARWPMPTFGTVWMLIRSGVCGSRVKMFLYSFCEVCRVRRVVQDCLVGWLVGYSGWVGGAGLLTLLRGCIGVGRRRFYMMMEGSGIGIALRRWSRLRGRGESWTL